MRNEAQLPILRVYTLIDNVRLHIDEIGQDFNALEGGLEFIEEVYLNSVVPAEQELVDFLTEREIMLPDLYNATFVIQQIANVAQRKHFPLAFEAQKKIIHFARRIGAPRMNRYLQVGDFQTLCILASEFGDVASEILDDMWRNDRWATYFEENPDYISTLPIFRAIESLRGRLTMEEWGKRRKLFFGESSDEMARSRMDYEDDEENGESWII